MMLVMEGRHVNIKVLKETNEHRKGLHGGRMLSQEPFQGSERVDRKGKGWEEVIRLKRNISECRH